MRFLAGLLLGLAVASIATGRFLVAVALYLLGGAIWLFIDRRRPFGQKPITAHEPSFAVQTLIFWPLRVLNETIGLLGLILRGERYVVLTDTVTRFRSARAANDYARTIAATTGQDVMVTDQAMLRWRFGQFENRYWFVRNR